MIKLLWNYKFLNFGYDRRMVQVSHVICRNTNLVHTTWLNCTIPRVYLSNVSMRHVHFALVSLQRLYASLYEGLRLCAPTYARGYGGNDEDMDTGCTDDDGVDINTWLCGVLINNGCILF
jgi:hypothetical protein